ncbi:MULTISPECIES: YdeI family protein [unclassified Arthrobacter]|uniref:YdeI/OmpD-associated family protein n=1 Tax=unclassified Arthrobacter TaxID=235627 RepID=UPI0021043577|nr:MULTISPECIES: YdeI/OmpD-associated family protein [unclassified Arthrobacter]MCQ1948184.1 YdeI/OmpD-associated family protein [Arthrobacter sp. zg-Y1116]MCQ1988158.1 YdeI/OmpD-associated family protein [Arthrobacter sp. zg-Y844]MCQ1996562.1 YdeI/OmpD-associated family protein [Arthrobacter sp. zg-Y1171]UWX82163.1 YdeI/OmpD-associated family protein [Arthrobacter sp. zg-Y1171]
MTRDLPELLLPDAGAWREWLEHNYGLSVGVRLVLGKKGGSVTRLTYREALQEALCFGWIDAQADRRDEQSYLQRFQPRGPRSNWSLRNVGYINRLEAEGRMHPAGRDAVLSAKVDGRWDAAYAGSATAEIPEDLRAAIAAVPAAQEMFDVLTSQNRFAMYIRLKGLKTQATRERWIADYVQMLSEHRAPYPQKRKPSPPSAVGQAPNA